MQMMQQMPNHQQQQDDEMWATTSVPATAPPASFPSQMSQQNQLQIHHQQALVPSSTAPANQWAIQQPQEQQMQQYQHQQQTRHAPFHQQQPYKQPQAPEPQKPQLNPFDPYASSRAPAPAPATNSATPMVSAPVPQQPPATNVLAYQQQQQQQQQQFVQQQQYAPAPAQALVPAPELAPQDDNPFGVFSLSHTAAARAEPPKSEVPATPVRTVSVSTGASESMTYDNNAATAAPEWLDVSTSKNVDVGGNVEAVAYTSAAAGELPSEGEYYQFDIVDHHLGILLCNASDLTTTILRHHHPSTIKSMGSSRPVVAHLAANSAAATAGIGLGDVLTAIDGREINDRDTASRMLREVGRPITLRMYRLPGTSPTVYEGELSVHYKNKSDQPPKRIKDWKIKYVVVGGIMSPRTVVNMYRSRAEYDQAVAEVHGGRPLTVKVKQFSLEGASLWSLPKEQNGHNASTEQNGMESLKYPGEAESRMYSQILVPKPGNNIKLSVPTSHQHQLRAVLDGVRSGM